MNADRIVALVALMAAVLAGTGLPTKLGLGPQAVTVIGGAIVGFAAVARGLVHMIRVWRENERRPASDPLPVAPDPRDILGAFLGCVAIGLGIEGVAVDQLDPDALAGLSSLGAMLFAWQRGKGGGGGFTAPPAAGLLLLVCACQAAPEHSTCAEFAARRVGDEPASGYRELYDLCVTETERGHEVCVHRDLSYGCMLLVPSVRNAAARTGS